MIIEIKTRGPAPKGADFIGLKEALAYLLEQHGFTDCVGRIDFQEEEK